MEPTGLIQHRRALKRKNYSVHTLKSYMNIPDQFSRWLSVPLCEITRKEIGLYVDHLLHKRRTPKTITCHLQTIRLFFDYGSILTSPLYLPQSLAKYTKSIRH
jgi:site-specific recombinase XerD